MNLIPLDEITDDKTMVSLHVAARYIGVSYPTIRRMRDLNQIEWRQIGQVYYITIGEVKRILTEGNRSVAPTSSERSTKTKIKTKTDVAPDILEGISQLLPVEPSDNHEPEVIMQRHNSLVRNGD